MQAYAPHCPVPREERWYAILADAPNNAVLTWTPLHLVEAENFGIKAAKQEQDARKTAESSNGISTPPLGELISKCCL